jgi:Protein of unknown function (DUF2939)
VFLNIWKVLTITLFTALLIVGFFSTPYIAIWRMKSAALGKDAKTFSSYIDFPVFKENLKSEMNAQMLVNVAKDQKLKENPFSGLALTVAPAIINNMIDGFVSSAGIEKLFNGDFENNPQLASSPIKPLTSDFMNENKGELSTGYNSFDEFEVSYKLKNDKKTTFVFERRNLFSWKLINMKFQ